MSASQPASVTHGARRLLTRSFMLRALAIGGGTVFGLLLLSGIGLTWYLKTLDFNSYKPMIQDAVLKTSGRALLIDGEMRLSVSLHPALRVEGVHLANPAGFSRPNTVDVARMDVEIALLPLLYGELLVEHVELLDPDILLERLADGRDNWSLPGELAGEGVSATAEASPDSLIILPRVHRVMIRNATLGFRDAGESGATSLVVPEIELWEGNAELDDKLLLRVRGEFEKVPLKFQGSISSLHALLANQALAVSLHASVPGVELKLGGSVDRPLDATGMALDVELSSPGMGSMAKLFKLSPMLGLAMHVKTTVIDDAGGYLLKGLDAKLGKNDVAGDVHIGMPQGRMRVDAALASRNISLVDLLPEEAQVKPASNSPAAVSGGKSPAARVLPDESLDLAMLRQMDGAIDWKIKRFAMPQLQLSDVQLKFSLLAGRLDVLPFEVRLAGGEMRTSLVLQAQKSPAILDISVSGRKIMADQLLAMRAGKDDAALMQGGSMDFDLGLEGRGKSVAEWMANSNGRIKLQMGEGKIKSTALNLVGGDVLMSLAGKLNPFSEKKEYMELQCGVVHFRVQDGMMLSDKGIAFETARMNILSEGKIDLHDESINLSFGTEPREGIGVNLSNMVNVVKLGGTLAEPGIVMDAAKTGMAAARTAGAVMTGGLSLLGEGLFNRATADSEPCKTALEME